MSKVRIGFIGAGRIADLHARAYADNNQAELAAIADPAPDRATERAAEWGASLAYSDYRDLLADDSIDGVEILLPHKLHSAIGIEALNAGKAVSLQKPPGVNMDEADKLYAAAKSGKPLFRVFDNFLSYEPFNVAKSIIDNGDIGDPLLFKISAVYGKGVGGWEIPEDASAWRADPSQNGGPPAIIDHGAHMAATIVSFMGPVDSVHTFNEMGEGDVSAGRSGPMTITFRFADTRRLGVWTMTGAPEIEIPTDYYPGDEFIEVTGTKGIVWVSRCSGKLLDAPPVSVLTGGKMRHFDDMEVDWGESFKAGGQEFARAIESGSQVDMDADMSRNVYAFQLAAVMSAAEQREVSVSEIG
ncbi:MAG: Gfo/Idh/MocA family oxidoreductase [Chloroflexi bacterium]|nr:Gfo/Idh/MocA family oxidoreductase [Chloroflexota bacterium]